MPAAAAKREREIRIVFCAASLVPLAARIHLGLSPKTLIRDSRSRQSSIPFTIALLQPCTGVLSKAVALGTCPLESCQLHAIGEKQKPLGSLRVYWTTCVCCGLLGCLLQSNPPTLCRFQALFPGARVLQREKEGAPVISARASSPNIAKEAVSMLSSLRSDALSLRDPLPLFGFC